MIIGYARVSTGGQNLVEEIDALTMAVAEKIFAGKMTVTACNRPELDRLLHQLRICAACMPTPKWEHFALSIGSILLCR
jgi:DNA invertase Pin-like site-specific DNA recombinase